ncbi:MAG: hypothetical protein IJB55_02180 [Firmicutes bacterium]|nr:hypothetical protein [Bacillota bacterium]
MTKEFNKDDLRKATPQAKHGIIRYPKLKSTLTGENRLFLHYLLNNEDFDWRNNEYDINRVFFHATWKAFYAGWKSCAREHNIPMDDIK